MRGTLSQILLQSQPFSSQLITSHIGKFYTSGVKESCKRDAKCSFVPLAPLGYCCERLY